MRRRLGEDGGPWRTASFVRHHRHRWFGGVSGNENFLAAVSGNGGPSGKGQRRCSPITKLADARHTRAASQCRRARRAGLGTSRRSRAVSSRATSKIPLEGSSLRRRWGRRAGSEVAARDSEYPQATRAGIGLQRLGLSNPYVCLYVRTLCERSRQRGLRGVRVCLMART